MALCGTGPGEAEIDDPQNPVTECLQGNSPLNRTQSVTTEGGYTPHTYTHTYVCTDEQTDVGYWLTVPCFPTRGVEFHTGKSPRQGRGAGVPSPTRPEVTSGVRTTG